MVWLFAHFSVKISSMSLFRIHLFCHWIYHLHVICISYFWAFFNYLAHHITITALWLPVWSVPWKWDVVVANCVYELGQISRHIWKLGHLSFSNAAVGHSQITLMTALGRLWWSLECIFWQVTRSNGFLCLETSSVYQCVKYKCSLHTDVFFINQLFIFINQLFENTFLSLHRIF